MIQIIGLREYFDQKTKRDSKKHAFFKDEIRAESVSDILMFPEKYLGRLPPEEHYNIFFTTAHCHGLKPRDFASQDVIPFDIDHMDIAHKDKVIEVVLTTLGLEFKKTGIICSGNGLQFFIHYPKFNEKLFKTKKEIYKVLCFKINAALKKAGLEGDADTSVFSTRRLMRVPETINKKKNKPDTKAYTIQGQIHDQFWSLEAALGMGEIHEKDHLSSEFVKRTFPDPDSKTILAECDFLAYCKSNPAEISEPQWYASLSVLGHFSGGRELAHEFSSGHPGYTVEETDSKLDQAMVASGPRTCANIDELWGKCSGCKHFQSNLVKSPIMIRGEDYIATQGSGFYDTALVNGKLSTRPNHNDLLRYFKKKYKYFVQSDTLLVYTYNGKYWEHMPEQEIKVFAENNFDPKPTETVRKEFLSKVLVNELRSKEWYEGSCARKICLQNGVYDLEKKELLPHSDEYFFTGVLPYEFDPSAKAPRFEKFMDEVTEGNHELKTILLEFAGYAVSGDPCWIHKALILPGEGSNGKSTFMKVLQNLVGPDLYSALQMSALDNDQKRYMLVNKLFNVGEETNIHALSRSESFKTLVSGGDVDIKVVFMKPFNYRNKAKFIFACNKLPYTNDQSYGLFRRLLIVPFNATFNHDMGNVDVDLDEKLAAELPGIFNILMEHYEVLRRRKKFAEGPATRKALSEYMDQNDFYKPFFEEKLHVTGQQTDYVSADEMFQAFIQFWEARGQQRKFFSYVEVLKKIRPFVEANGGVYGRLRKGDDRKFFFRGVKLWGDF